MIEQIKWSKLPLILLVVVIPLSVVAFSPAQAQGGVSGISCVADDDPLGRRCSMDCANFRRSSGCQYLRCLQDLARTTCVVTCAALRAATQSCDAFEARQSRRQSAENVEARRSAINRTGWLGATALGLLATAGVIGMAGLGGVFTLKMSLVAVGVGVITATTALLVPDAMKFAQGAGSFIENHVAPRLSDAIDNINSRRPN